MKKRLLSLLLALCMMLTLCVPQALADRNEIEGYNAPTNPRWEGSTMVWDWDSSAPGEEDYIQYFDGFELILYYSATEPDENTDWQLCSQPFAYGRTQSKALAE